MWTGDGWATQHSGSCRLSTVLFPRQRVGNKGIGRSGLQLKLLTLEYKENRAAFISSTFSNIMFLVVGRLCHFSMIPVSSDSKEFRYKKLKQTKTKKTHKDWKKNVHYFTAKSLLTGEQHSLRLMTV